MGRTRHFETGLTPRQKEVLRLIAKGHTNGEIAEKLGVSLAGAKWHVSELLSRFGVNSREDLAELMERERRGPVERTRGWMAGLAGLVTLKVGAGTAVAAGVVVAAGVGVAGAAVMLSNESSPPASSVREDVEDLLPDDPGDSLYAPEEAYGLAEREAERLFEGLNKQAGPGLEFELAEARWLPSSTGFWFRGFGWKWESANREVFDLWAFRWELVDGSLVGKDGQVTVLVSDGHPIPFGAVGVFGDWRTGAEFTLHSGVAPSPTVAVPPPPPTDAWAVSQSGQVLRAMLGAVDHYPWCGGSGDITAVGPAQTTAECPVVLPEHEPIRPYMDVSGLDGTTMRTLHVAFRHPISRIVVRLDNGAELEMTGVVAPKRGETHTGSLMLPEGVVPKEIVGFDAAGDEVGRREYPPRPVRP